MARPPRTSGEQYGATALTGTGRVYGRGGAKDGDIIDEEPDEQPDEGREDEGDSKEDAYIPEGYESVSEFLAMATYEFDLDYQADEHNILEAMEDLRFTYIDHWDSVTRIEREEMGRPCITINTLPQFAGQVIGDRRINKTTIKVIPSHNGTVELA